MSMVFAFNIFLQAVLLTGDSSLVFYRYDAQKAETILEKEICKDRFWMQPDDTQGNPYFITKGDFRKAGKVKVVPVLRLSNKFKEYDYSRDILDYYELDYSQFCGLIFKGDKFLDIMFVTYSYNQRGRLIPAASLGDTPSGFYEVYRRKADSFFYDGIIHSFCFFEGNELYVWSNETQQFVSYKTMIEVEKFGLDAFKKTITGG